MTTITNNRTMKFMTFFILSVVCCLFSLRSSAQSTQVVFQTSHGDIVVALYDDTPLHRDMFIQAVSAGKYQKTLFNRVIKDFVNQGGELDELILAEEQDGTRTYARLPAEIRPHHIHQKGALGAGRDANPDKASFLSQIYFVVGKVFTEKELSALEKKRNIKVDAAHRGVYTSLGGVPHLDGDYTIFGEVLQGLDVVERINALPTDKNDMPLSTVEFSVHVVPIL